MIRWSFIMCLCGNATSFSIAYHHMLVVASRACRWSHLRQLVGILPSPLQTSPPAMADVSSKHTRRLACGSAHTFPATSPPVKYTHYIFEQWMLIIRARRSLDLRAQPSPQAMFARVRGGAPASMRVKCNDTRPACHRSFYGLFLPLTVLNVSVFRTR